MEFLLVTFGRPWQNGCGSYTGDGDGQIEMQCSTGSWKTICNINQLTVQILRWRWPWNILNSTHFSGLLHLSWERNASVALPPGTILTVKHLLLLLQHRLTPSKLKHIKFVTLYYVLRHVIYSLQMFHPSSMPTLIRFFCYWNMHEFRFIYRAYILTEE